MSYFYCRECRKVYACSCGQCNACQEGSECYMRTKMWKVAQLTFKEDDHESLCPGCKLVWG